MEHTPGGMKYKPPPTLNAWWKDGIQHTRWMCAKCLRQYHTVAEAEECRCGRKKAKSK